jgi:Domain of unknown function (DUF4342)
MSDFGSNGGGGSDAGQQSGASTGEGGARRVYTERLRVTGSELWGKLRQLLHEGNVRRLIVRSDDEHVLIEIPVTVGVVGLVLAPFAVAVGAIAAMVTHCTIEVERVEEEGHGVSESAAPGGASRAAAEYQPVAEPLSTGTAEKAAGGPKSETAGAGAEKEVASEEKADAAKKRRRRTT